MTIKRFPATADNTITNAFKPNLSTRGTGSNMGASDILEVFSIYAQATTSSTEAARILTNFSITNISSARTDGDIPASGSVNFYLKMFNAEHPFTLPRDFKLMVVPISASWNEGNGLDMDEYTDDGQSNWERRNSSSGWTIAGGDYMTASLDINYSQTFSDGHEDLEVEVTEQVEEWIKGESGSYGFGIYLTASLESGTDSYYTKKFHSRSSEFFLKRPVIEARWDDAKKDNSSNFYLKDNRLSTTDNLNTIYLYNHFKGDLKNLPDDPSNIYVNVYSGSTAPSGSAIGLPAGGGVASAGQTNITGSKVSTGIYSASFAYSSSLITTIFPVWHQNSSLTYITGSGIGVKSLPAADLYTISEYVVNITNLKPSYSTSEVAKFRVYSRDKNWQPTIYSVARNAAPLNIIDDLFYRVSREEDDFTVVDYGTGSIKYTQLSYDISGSYFDFDMSILESGYSYKIGFVYLENGKYRKIKDKFRFRVEG